MKEEFLVINTPKITIFEYELIINQKLYDKGIISEKQYHDVCKIINKKISQYIKTKRSDREEL